MADMYLKIDGIDGDARDDKHKKEIEVLSWSHGISQDGGGSNTSAGFHAGGRVHFQDFHFTKQLDSASPSLWLHCCQGKPIKSAKLTLNRAMGDKTVFMTYEFKNLIISSQSIGASKGGDDMPTEQISFKFSEVKLEYTPTNPDGTKGSAQKADWSLDTNKRV